MKKIVKGNDFLMKITISNLQTNEEFDLTKCENISVGLTQGYYVYDCNILQIDTDILWVRVEGDEIKSGIFGISIKGKYNSNDWRFTDNKSIEIVEEATTDDEVSDPSKLKEIEITVYYNYTSLPTTEALTLTIPDGMNLYQFATITVSPFLDTSLCTSFESFYRSNSYATTLNLTKWNTSNVTNMFGIFFGCDKLTSLDISNWDTSNVTNMSSMFINCYKLTSLDLSNWDTSNVTDMSYIFDSCSKLTSIIGNHTLEEVESGKIVVFKGIKCDLSINLSTRLDRKSLLAIIKGLANVTSSQTLTMGSTLLAKLTDDDKKIATDKGWTLE